MKLSAACRKPPGGLRKGGFGAITLIAALLLSALPRSSAAAPFDLAGPKLKIAVTRGGRTLPIAKVPALAAGDQITIEPDFPAANSPRYLLVVSFLRGAASPPPESWFSKTATWKPTGRTLRVTVPPGAQQALVFLAPQTGGDFRTLVGGVRARPGAFVRASQELNQAGLDRARLEAFTSEVARINRADPNQLKTASPLLARSLGVKIDPNCLQKVTETQASCLVQERDSLVLDDAGHRSRLEALTSGYSAELARQLSNTPWAGAGNYSPYVASLFDIVHLLEASRTARYQYIPALGVAAEDHLALFLNAPPSFRNPQSVLVAALPSVEPDEPPELHALEPETVSCLSRPGVVLPMANAPLVFATGYAHDLKVRVRGPAGDVELPAHADAARGGLVLDQGADPGFRADGVVEGRVAGDWGFTSFQGPPLRFAAAQPQAWSAAGNARPSLVVGQESTVRLTARQTACVEDVRLQLPSGAEQSVEWETAPGELSVRLPPKPAGAGVFKLLIRMAGVKAPDVVPLGLYARPSAISEFVFHAGDATATLTGERLDQVREVAFEGATFSPSPAADNSEGRLQLVTSDAAGLAALNPGDTGSGQVQLKDGRSLPFRATVARPRPRISLISRDVQPTGAESALPIRLGDKDEAPLKSRLTFSIRAESPAVFSGRESLEISAGSGAFTTQLTTADGLVLQDPKVAVASLEIDKKFPASAFGKLRFRLLADGVPSEWLPLATLVRLPRIESVVCQRPGEDACVLKGSQLFLIAAVSADPHFEKSTTVPDGLASATLTTPRPRSGRLYLKLRDNPGAVATLVAGERSGSDRVAQAQAATRPSRAP